MKKILLGNNLEHLKNFEDNTFDACITDPPWMIKFMNLKWDYEIPSAITWKEILRVLKPGAHILVCCGARTQHRMAVNIEDAGFDIREIITHHFGSGFPKSRNIHNDFKKQFEEQLKLQGVKGEIKWK